VLIALQFAPRLSSIRAHSDTIRRHAVSQNGLKWMGQRRQRHNAGAGQRVRWENRPTISAVKSYPDIDELLKEIKGEEEDKLDSLDDLSDQELAALH
jgi:hypothetical protein